jgi:hypothetical protein
LPLAADSGTWVASHTIILRILAITDRPALFGINGTNEVRIQERDLLVEHLTCLMSITHALSK